MSESYKGSVQKTAVNEINMAKWISALRSGKYKQGHGKLRNGDMFCCLAVQCDISGLGVWEQVRGGGLSYVTARDASSTIMPAEVTKSLFPQGIEAASPVLEERSGGKSTTCIAANDVKGWSFNQIADALESRYLPNTTAAAVLSQTEEGK